MNKSLLFFTICTVILFGSMPTRAAILYGHGSCSWDGATPDEEMETLYRIDTIEQTVTALGREADRNCASPEVQIDPTGEKIYMPLNDWSAVEGGDMFLVSPVDGLNKGVIALSGYPADTDTITALEFVGPILYGSAHDSGPEEYDGILVTIDTTTGVMTEIGPLTGMDKPTGGMSYVDGVMYAISSTDSTPYDRLFTVDLNTGVTTVVANITKDGVQQWKTTALAYADGKMYLLINQVKNLYSIDLVTGELTLEFDMGIYMNSLTAFDVAPVDGDVDGDGIITGSDLTALISNIGRSSGDCPACDVNGDGTINTLDVRQLISDNPTLARDRGVRRQVRRTSRRSGR